MPETPDRAAPVRSWTGDNPCGKLPPGKACVFYTELQSAASPRVLNDCLALLSDDEMHQHRAFRFEEDRELYLAAHALLRTSLSRFSDAEPSTWRFQSGPHGRPELIPAQRAGTGLRFNLSHTRRLAACVVARDADIGIDVERLDRDVAADAIAQRHFAPCEAAAIARLDASPRTRRFLEYWTLKEAFVKAQGGGLSIPLNAFHFQRDEAGRWQIGFADAKRPSKQWQFVCLEPTPSHVMSIAIHRPEQPDYDIAIRHVTPLR